MKAAESYLSRRRFVAGMLGGAAAALGAAALPPALRYAGNLQAEPPPDFVELQPADYAVAAGRGRLFMYGRLPGLLLRTPLPEGELRLFLAVCTHLDCTVGYRPAENRIFCACHEGYYDTAGQVLAGPPPRPLRRFHHRFRGDALVVALEEEGLERAFAPAT